MNAVLIVVQVSLLNVIEPSIRSVSNHPPSSHGLRFGFVPWAYRAKNLLTLRIPLAGTVSVTWASPLPSRLATTRSRIEFVILRTGCSPPVALHPLSRGCSYFQLQSSNRKNLDEDFHLANSMRSQAH